MRGVLWLKAGNSLKRKYLKHALNGCIADKNVCCNSFKEEQRVTGNPPHVSTGDKEGWGKVGGKENCQTLN